MKIIFLSAIVIILLLIWWLFFAPFSLKFKEEIELGNSKVELIKQYYKKYDSLPDDKFLQANGVRTDIEKVYFEYIRKNDSVFLLIYPIGFDPPYLYYNSAKKKWNYGFPK